MHDHERIADLVTDRRLELLEVCRTLGDREALLLDRRLEEALATGAEEIVVATHIPPFPEAARFGKHPCDRSWQPWMVCAATGRTLLRTAAAHPEVHFHVLAGHAHERARLFKEANLEVWTGSAEYHLPRVEHRFG